MFRRYQIVFLLIVAVFNAYSSAQAKLKWYKGNTHTHTLNSDGDSTPDDVVMGSPPLAFTFGLGGLLLFPMHVGAATVLLPKAGPNELLEAIPRFGATVLFTAPTSYRALAPQGEALRHGSLRHCVSAGEALPVSTRTLWREATGIELIDGIGATELLHIFISADEEHAHPGATGKVVPGYQAQVQDDDGNPVPVGTVGKLAVVPQVLVGGDGKNANAIEAISAMVLAAGNQFRQRHAGAEAAR